MDTRPSPLIDADSRTSVLAGSDVACPYADGWDEPTLREGIENSDAVLAAKFYQLPDIIESWVSPYLDLTSANLMDFGCGFGETAAGFAFRKRPQSVVGVDIVGDLFHCVDRLEGPFGIDELPENLTLSRIAAGSIGVHGEPLDLIYSWSVFEHIQETLIEGILTQLRDALSSQGYLFLQVAPLFFSPAGSHMQALVTEPWAHLLHQHDVFVKSVRDSSTRPEEGEALVKTYETLNRLPADRFVGYVKSAGFEIIREHRTHVDDVPPARLLECYREEILREEQIVILARVAPGIP